jgi:histidinol-phosphate/aromatic aminotransferase/cobyric acid decarboxylase-like protein
MLLGQITDKTRLIILNSPANPTGGAVPKEEIAKLVAGLQPMAERRVSCPTRSTARCSMTDANM